MAALTTTADLPPVERVFSKAELLEVQHLVRQVPVSPHVVSYAVALARATRPHAPEGTAMMRQYAQWGAGPRASQYLLLGAKALAVMEGKPTASANDVRQVAPHVLRHRVIPNYAAVADDITAAHLVEDLLRQVKEPAYETM